MADDQSTIDIKNSEFWNTLCGSSLAQTLGVTDTSIESLKRFDDWYMDFYPYLVDHIPFSSMTGKRVLEVGLGYGTIAQKIAEAGADYHGLDIAPAAADMANHRINQLGLSGSAQCSSILDAPFPDDHFDMVVSIGCLHHTGNLQRALDEVRRILKPGGTAIIMVYNALSFRRWHQAKEATESYLQWRLTGAGNLRAIEAIDRFAYDTDLEGNAAPETTFVSIGHLADMCSRFSRFQARLENIEQEPPFMAFTRKELLQTSWPAMCGLDIYATMVK
jgi:SAM-dependent methyltransferase